MKTFFSIKIIKVALLVGTLDLLAACAQFYLKTNKGPVPVLKFIASGIFGKKAFTEGNIMIFYGLLFHFFIAFAFTFFFFWVCNKFPGILKMKLLAGILFGGFIWTIMNFVVLPISNVNRPSFDVTNAIIQMVILIACIGIPLSLLAPNQIHSRK